MIQLLNLTWLELEELAYSESSTGAYANETVWNNGLGNGAGGGGVSSGLANPFMASKCIYRIFKDQSQRS